MIDNGLRKMEEEKAEHYLKMPWEAALESAEKVSDKLSKEIISEQEAAELAKKSVTEVTAEPTVSEIDMLKLLAEQMGLPFYPDLSAFSVDPELLKEIPYNLAQAYKIFPLKKEADGSILVALGDPLKINVLDDLQLLLDRKVNGAIVPEKEIKDAIDAYYGIGEETIEKVVELMASQAEFEIKIEPKSGSQMDLTDLERLAHEPPVIRLVNLLLLHAIRERASDLHIEPFGNALRIRYRVDGILHEITPPPKHLQLGICSRLKVLAGMDIAERRLPQDGRIRLSLAGRQIDMRVSTLPTVWGESIVIRILDKSMMMMGLEQIGLLPEVYDKLKELISKPNGIILATGPTGCGKTTTLYAILQEIYSPEIKIITTEDPVEYEMEGIVQININPSIGLTFANCLRSILRHDPDVILIGEIRDLESAEIAIQASLTGHLVLSTLHTNDAATTITRLIDMEIEPYLIASTLEGVIAQRLVRTICPSCKTQYTPPKALIEEIGLKDSDLRGVTFYQGAGCEECNYTGYKGRIGVFELLLVSDNIRDLIMRRASAAEIAAKAKEEGMMTMREDGVQKVLAGITTVEEVLRVTYGVAEIEPEPVMSIPEKQKLEISEEAADKIKTASTDREI